MASVAEEDIRTMFRAMRGRDASPRESAAGGRGIAADPCNHKDFLTMFETMLDQNFKIVDEVFETLSD